MDTWIFLTGLFLITMAIFMGWAMRSKKLTERRLNDPDAPKSTLAKDGPGPNPATAPRHGDAQPRNS